MPHPVEALARLANGDFLDTLADALAAIAAEVSESGQPGKVAVTFTVKPLGEPGNVMLAIEPVIGRTPPKSNVGGTIFYSIGGQLESSDTRQIPLEGFRDVSASVEIRDSGFARNQVREG